MEKVVHYGGVTVRLINLPTPEEQKRKWEKPLQDFWKAVLREYREMGLECPYGTVVRDEDENSH